MRCPLTIITDVLTASDTLCLSSAAVPGLFSPRVNFLASDDGAEAIAPPFIRQPGRRGERAPGCPACVNAPWRRFYPAIALRLNRTRARSRSQWSKDPGENEKDFPGQQQPETNIRGSLRSGSVPSAEVPSEN